MKFIKTKIEGLVLIDLEPKVDDRGSLERFFCLKEFSDNDINFNLVQASRTVTNRQATIRGMHFQVAPHTETKIVQCLRGVIYDVVVDLRMDSSSYGQWLAVELSERNKKMIYIPKGCAHGFQTLVDDCELEYFMDEYYHGESASGVRYDDPKFAINWPLQAVGLSVKDRNWPLIKT